MKKIKFLAYTLLAFIAVMAIFSGELFAGSAGVISAAVGGGMVGYNRDIYKELAMKYKGLAPSYLRIEQTLSNSKGEYSFDVLKSNGVDIATEKKLDRNDVFIATQVGLFLSNQQTAKIGKEVLKTWPDTATFTDTSTFTVADLNAIYSGYMWVKINTQVEIENLSLLDFRRIGVTAATEFNREEYSRGLEQFLVLSGNNTNEIKINFPTFTGMQIAASASGYSNKLVLMFFGFLARGINK